MEDKGGGVMAETETGLLTLKPCMKTSSNVFLIAAGMHSRHSNKPSLGDCLHGVSRCSPR